MSQLKLTKDNFEQDPIENRKIISRIKYAVRQGNNKPNFSNLSETTQKYANEKWVELSSKQNPLAQEKKKALHRIRVNAARGGNKPDFSHFQVAVQHYAEQQWITELSKQDPFKQEKNKAEEAEIGSLPNPSDLEKIAEPQDLFLQQDDNVFIPRPLSPDVFSMPANDFEMPSSKVENPYGFFNASLVDEPFFNEMDESLMRL